MPPSTRDTIATVQLQLFCAQAHAAWSRVEILDAERKTGETRLRDMRHERLWAATDIARARLDVDIAAVSSQLDAKAPVLSQARDAALVASERAAAYGWGIRLGRRYHITRDGITSNVLVQGLRPLPANQGAGRMLASGEADGRPAMFVLGRDSLHIVPADQDNVIDITARLSARRPGAR